MKIEISKNHHRHSLLIYSFVVFLSFFSFFITSICVANTHITTLTEPDSNTFYFSTDIFQQNNISLESDYFKGTAKIFGSFFSILFSVAGVLMVVLFAVYGTQLIYSQAVGNIALFVNAKKHIIDITIGVCLLLFSWVILNFVNPDLLKPNILQELRGFKSGKNINLAFPEGD